MLLSYARLFLISAALAFTAASVSAQTNSSQATEAAKKHQAAKASDKSTGAKPTAASNASVAQSLEACKKNASWNVVKREQCVWNLCKGRWGKQGCPAEATSKPSTPG